MDFGRILKRAWEIIWNHKVLWIFGILAGCGRQAGGSGGGSGGQGPSYQFEGGDFEYMPREVERFFEDFGRTLGDIPEETFIFVAIGLVVLVLIMALIFFVISTYGRVALVKGTVQVEDGAEKLAFGQLTQDSMPYMLRALGLNFLIFLVYLVIGLGVAIAVVLLGVLTLGIGVICVLPLVCVLIPVMWFVGVIVEQSNVALVVDDLGVMDSIQKGWSVVRENIGSMIVMGLILILGGLIVSFVIGLPLLFVLAPVMAAVIGGAVSESLELILGGVGFYLLCTVLYIPVLLVLGGILTAYIESAWTLTYLDLTGRAGEAVAPDDSLEDETAAA
jgi:hypothetical protein